eukprot:COSAG04_NODE_711_length_10885_cov_5.273225_9_plen_84_part_00
MWARRSGLTYPALPWVVILVVSMIYRVFVFQTKNEQVPWRADILGGHRWTSDDRSAPATRQQQQKAGFRPRDNVVNATFSSVM